MKRRGSERCIITSRSEHRWPPRAVRLERKDSMNTMRHDPNRRTRGSVRFLMILALTGLAISPTTKAETLETFHSVCRSGDSDELNRWPLRVQDFSGCVEKGQKSPIFVRRYGQEASVNLWPYAPEPQKMEPLEVLPNEEDQDRPPTYVRTEPDLRMWPLWPQS